MSLLGMGAPPGFLGLPASAWGETLDADGNNQLNRSWRMVTVPLLAGGREIRATIYASASADFTPLHIAVGVWTGTNHNTVATPVELLVGGVAWTAISSGQNRVSDWHPFSVAAGARAVMIMDNDATNPNPRTKSGSSQLHQNSALYTSAATYNNAAPGAGDTTSGMLPFAFGDLEVR